VNLIVQPEAAKAPVFRAIQKSRERVDIAIFRCDRAKIEKALASAVQRGVRVRVLVAHTNSGGENRLRKLEQRLLEAGATVARTGSDFVRYHGKFMLADDTLHLFGFNFTKVDTVKSRSFGLSTRDATSVREAAALFEADCARQPYVPRRTRLVVSPENAREQLAAFIKGARRQLLVYDVGIQDPVMAKLLKERAAAGIDIRVLGKFKGSGEIAVRALKPLRLHVRAIIRDASRAFVGSQSLKRLELDQRREVGVLITNPTVARTLHDIFEADWADSASAKDDKAETHDKTTDGKNVKERLRERRLRALALVKRQQTSAA
jgi:phosphatidylserine/phosphatidylglycerophosphate/cardiolipin synthase-like enzyme